MPKVLDIWCIVGLLLCISFFFSIGELTITLEDVVNNFPLPMFDDEGPFDIQLSTGDLTVEE